MEPVPIILKSYIASGTYHVAQSGMLFLAWTSQRGRTIVHKKNYLHNFLSHISNIDNNYKNKIITCYSQKENYTHVPTVHLLFTVRRV